MLNPLLITTVAIVAGLLTATADELELKRLDPEELNTHPYYSQLTTVQGDAKFIYVAGQTDRAVDYQVGDDACRHDDWRGQYEGVHENVGKALAAAGATWDDVVFIRRFVTDMIPFRQIMGNKDNPPPRYFANRPPPSTLIQVVALSEPCQLIEVDVFAVIGAD